MLRMGETISKDKKDACHFLFVINQQAGLEWQKMVMSSTCQSLIRPCHNHLSMQIGFLLF